jgi:hypothetical protein
MALTVVGIFKVALQPSEFMAIIKVTGDATYPGAANAHGYPITPALFTFNTFASTSDFQLNVTNSPPAVPTAYYIGADLAPNAGAGGTYSEIDDTTGNLRMYAAAGTEIASAASATAVSATLIAFGH